MGVTVERSLGITVLRLIAGEVPDDQALITRGGQEHVGARSDKLAWCKHFHSFAVVEVVVLLH